MKKISVIGVGRLGLCFSLTLERAGYDVVGCDINAEHVSQINQKTLKSPEQGVEDMLSDAVNFKATVHMDEVLNHSGVLFAVVATPSLENGRSAKTLSNMLHHNAGLLRYCAATP